MNELEELRKLTKVLTSNGYLTDQTKAWEYAFNSVDILILITNPSYKVKFVNRSLNNFLKKEKYELINKKASDIIDGELITVEEESTPIDKRGNVDLGTSFIKSFAAWVRKRKFAINDDAGNLIGYLFTINDVTETELATRKVHEAYNQMLSMFDSMDEVAYVSDPKTHEILFVNKIGRDVFGENIVGKKCFTYLQGKTSPCNFCTNAKIFEQGNEGRTYSWVTKNKINGEWYKCIDRAIKWHDGRMVRFELAVNITDQKMYENKISQALKRIHFMLTAADGYMWEKEYCNEQDEMAYVYADASFCKDLLGLEADEDGYTCSRTYKKTCSEIVESNFKDKGKKHTLSGISKLTDIHTMSQGIPCEYIEMGYVEQIKGKPEWTILRVRKTPLYNDSGECTGMIGFASKYSNISRFVKGFIEKGIVTGSIIKLETNSNESKIYWVMDTDFDEYAKELTHVDFP